MAVEREIGTGLGKQKEECWWVGGGVGLQGSRVVGGGNKVRWERQEGKNNSSKNYYPIYIHPIGKHQNHGTYLNVGSYQSHLPPTER